LQRKLKIYFTLIIVYQINVMMNIMAFYKSAEGGKYFFSPSHIQLNKPNYRGSPQSPILVSLIFLSRIFVARSFSLKRTKKRGSGSRFTVWPGRWQKQSPLKFSSAVLKGKKLGLGFGVLFLFLNWMRSIVYDLEKKNSSPMASSQPHHSGQLGMQEPVFVL